MYYMVIVIVCLSQSNVAIYRVYTNFLYFYLKTWTVHLVMLLECLNTHTQ